MKKILITLCLSLLIADQAHAFNIDPTKYEYMGQNEDKCGVFYEIATAKAVGDNASVVMIEADPKNRTLRYYYNEIDPVNSTVVNSYCELYDYNHNLLEKYKVSDEPVNFKQGDIVDSIYNDLVDKGIVDDPRKVVPPPVEPPPIEPPQPPQPPQPPKVKKPIVKITDTQRNKLTGGKKTIVSIGERPTDKITML